MDFTLYWFMFPVSILVATCAMLSGIGGAALFMPVFVLVFPLLGPEYALGSTVAAVATALMTQTFGFLSGLVGYYRRGLIDYRIAGRIARIAVPAAVTGAFAAGMVHESLLLGSYALLVAALSYVMMSNPNGYGSRGLAPKQDARRTITDSRGVQYSYDVPILSASNVALTGLGAFLTGLVSVGIGELTISQLTRKGLPVAVAAATSVLVVIVTVVLASSTLVVQLVDRGGWSAVPWNLLVYSIPGVLIGGQIGPLLQGYVPQEPMRKAIGVLFAMLALAMLFVALRKSEII